MLIHLNDEALADDLCAHFTRSGFTAEPLGGGMIELTRPDSPGADEQGRDAVLQLQAWKRRHARFAHPHRRPFEIPGRGAKVVELRPQLEPLACRNVP